ncbi:uncharacterized protein B0H18DRAFT_938290 [Fomitopsis serialis]|uniref:uncharacterized protein n=1 Tax=Fomitopsis serialis TaxID=139415 RepID=UPI0020082808|nr:uncharacterized protein B0H18DRAFT_938290 [Neoantrodia serialis]KAH9917741.1 hypothetical protein B0H18DRAFT_938290 [Neoantrodia serialis]
MWGDALHSPSTNCVQERSIRVLDHRNHQELVDAWSMLDDLHKISQETLVINGADDEVINFVVGPLF